MRNQNTGGNSSHIAGWLSTDVEEVWDTGGDAEPALGTTGEQDGNGSHSPRQLKDAFKQLRIQLTVPYVFLALVVAFITALLVTQLVANILDGLFKTALVEAGQKAADTVVYVERDQLRIWRLMAYTEGLTGAVVGGEAETETIEALIRPLAVNEHLDAVEVLDGTGGPLVTLHHRTGGSAVDYDSEVAGNYREWPLVRKALSGQSDELGDKYADLVETDQGWIFYTAGPLRQGEEIVGVLLVGTYLDNLVERLDRAAFARVSVYVEGEPVATRLPYAGDVFALDEDTYRIALGGQGHWVLRRQIEVAGHDYVEIFGAFEVRQGQDLGVLSVAMPLTFITDARGPTRGSLFLLFGLFTLLILLVGAWLSGRVVERVRLLAVATEQVAEGDLTTQVDPRGFDEVASLATSFNRMVVQLREGRIYRDLLGLTASPEVAEQLRYGVEGGSVRLDAQQVTATVLFCDIRGFSRISETAEPAEVIELLNEYMRGIVQVIRNHNGVVNKFVGDAALAFFGVLPEPRSPADSAQDALAAAVALLEYVDAFNRRRQSRGEEPLRVGIGINTGSVVAGVVGSEERLEYTVLGDAVNVAQRLSDFNKEYDAYDIFFAAETYQGLNGRWQDQVAHIGCTRVKGRQTLVDVYALGKRRIYASYT
ncbi:MAG: adenylate/guanylate cyclase domain-containing protein [Anaerolineales bacterium]